MCYRFECKRVFGFKCVGAIEIAHVTEEMAEAALREVDGDDIDAIVQCGTNLSFVGVADRMESVLGKPIIPINAATLCCARALSTPPSHSSCPQRRHAFSGEATPAARLFAAQQPALSAAGVVPGPLSCWR